MGSFAIIGAGLAGCECALTLARHGIKCALFEQKPKFRSLAHKMDSLAELVCSNSLRSAEHGSAIGLLKDEMRQLGSFFMAAADQCQVPADKALAVDREEFSRLLTDHVKSSPHISFISRQIESLDDPALAGYEVVIVAAGPLASENLSSSLANATGSAHLYFYDAIAPIVWADSLNTEIVFRASRYDVEPGGGDYLNCPMNREEYEVFYNALISADTYQTHEFEKEKYFEGCMPIEALARRGIKTLAFGPLKPIGFVDPRSGKRPWAVLQLRFEQASGQSCNLVGCQTKLLQKEQKRVFSLVPGLENVEFVRYGSMHRNTFVNAPKTLAPDLSLKARPDIHLAGQICGVEGYVESAASGLWLGHYLAMKKKGHNIGLPPAESAMGALLGWLGKDGGNFQPSNMNFGLMLESTNEKLPKKERNARLVKRAENAFSGWLANTGLAG